MLLHQQHGSVACCQCDTAVYELRPGEALSAFCQKRNGGMAVLRDRTGQKYRERHYSGRKERHEYHVRARFRDYSYQCGQKDHKRSVVADPMVDFYILKGKAKNKKHSECPCEYSGQMSLYYMFPKMAFNEMV